MDATAKAFLGGDSILDSDKLKKELAGLGLPNTGALAWYSVEPSEVLLTKYNETQFIGAAKNLEFANFILKVDVTWNSKSGLAGCGIILRATPPLSTGPQYQFSALRLSGAPAWDMEYWNNGAYVASITGEVKYNKVISQSQGATNTYHLLVNKDKLAVIANGTKLGEYTYDKQSKGIIGWFGFQESGETSCVFKNAWIWQLPDK